MEHRIAPDAVSPGVGTRRRVVAAALAAGLIVAPAVATGVVAPDGGHVARAGAPAPPETTITSGPSGVVRDGQATFHFSSSEPGSSFDCRLDGGGFTLRAGASAPIPRHVFDPGWAPCSSPISYSGLVSGSHTFEVHAISPVGVDDPTPASHSFTVDTSIPVTVSARKAQRQKGRRIRVELKVKARDAVTARARGKIKVRDARARSLRRALEPISRSLAAGETAALRLRPKNRADARRIARALARDRKTVAKLTVKLRDGHGNSASRFLTVRLRRG